MYAITSDSNKVPLGSGELIYLNQDVTTNTYKSFEPILNLGTFTSRYSSPDNAYFYQIEYTDADSFREVTHLFYDGVLYELRFEETETRLSLLPVVSGSPFYSVRFYLSDMASNTPANTLRMWFREGGDHTVIFGKMKDVTETISEYDSLYGSIAPLGIVGNAERVIDVSDLKAGSTFDFTISYDYLLQATGTVGDSSPFLMAYFYDENFEYVGDTKHFTYELDGVTDNRIHGTHTATVTVPEGAAYFSLICVLPHINVQECRMMQFMVRNFEISCLTSALVANSESLGVIQNKIDRVQQDIQDVNNRLDQVDQGIQDTNDKLDKIEDSLTPTPEQSDKADQMEDAIGNAAGNLENNSSSLEQLTPNKPQISTDLQLDEPNLLAVSPLVTNIWSISGVTRMVGIVVMIATVAYVFFGKRDG